MNYHVVCHDCTFEDVFDSINGALPAAREHRLETAHDIEYEQID
jgi:hypothetical protein